MRPVSYTLLIKYNDYIFDLVHVPHHIVQLIGI